MQLVIQSNRDPHNPVMTQQNSLQMQNILGEGGGLY